MMRDGLFYELGVKFPGIRVRGNETDLADGTALRRRFEAVLAALFRRAALSPAAAFAYLGLVLLDLERLRGELLRRAVFPRRALAA